MAYNEFLGERIATSLAKPGVVSEEKRMMGGFYRKDHEGICSC